MLQKKAIIIWQVKIDNKVVSKLVETKASSKHLIGIKVDGVIRPLVLITPKMSGYVNRFKVEVKISILVSFHVDDEKLLEKYKAIWTKIENLKNIEILNWMLYQSIMADI